MANFVFQISKMKIFKLFHFKFQKWKFSNFFSSNFRGIFQFLLFPSSGMANFCQISIQISKSIFSIFPFPSSGMTNFFQNSKTKVSIQISKTFFFQIFLVAYFFSAQDYQIYLKNAKITYLPLLKINIVCIRTNIKNSDMIYRKKALFSCIYKPTLIQLPRTL
jgi:hypothetical protein